MPPVGFESRPTKRLFFLGLIAAIPSAFLFYNGSAYAFGSMFDLQTSLIYFALGAPCLVVALVFLSRLFTKKRIVLYPAQMEIRIGDRNYIIRWDSVRDVAMTGPIGIRSIRISTPRRSFWLSQLDFPSLPKLFDALQAARSGDLFAQAACDPLE